MAARSAPEKPNVIGYSAIKGNGVLHVTLHGATFGVGGSLSFKTARELARAILDMTGKDSADDRLQD
jgi:hypothetical protein